ncbi:hypothetical protein [Candidatus Phytoplasma ziziphi]|nr:hypothetical protein [Candidatus Phytoplasma ziziphi]
MCNEKDYKPLERINKQTNKTRINTKNKQIQNRIKTNINKN